MSAEATNPCVFRHHAMSTQFEVRIAGEESAYAAQASRAAFAIVDRLEDLLSRYREDSEISQIRRLDRGESLRLSLDTFACLTLALEIQDVTGGAFDPGLGAEMDKIRGGQSDLVSETVQAESRLILDEESLSVAYDQGSVSLDLGAIGKGYALDCMAELLGEWGIEQALLISGGSSILALSPPEGASGWEVALSGSRRLFLSHTALSCSGIEVRGAHILDPRTGLPATGAHRAWALADSAAISDALSTAWMVLSPEEIAQICESRPGFSAILQARADTPQDLRTIALPERYRWDS